MVGREYDALIPSFTRQPPANEVIAQILAPANGVILIKRVWLGQVGQSNLNEPNAVQFVTVDSAGTGGAAVTFDSAPGNPAYAGSGNAVDNDGWTAAPNVTASRKAMQFNLAGGFEWAPTDPSGYVLVRPGVRFGFRIVRQPSVSLIWVGGITFQDLS